MPSRKITKRSQRKSRKSSQTRNSRKTSKSKKLRGGAGSANKYALSQPMMLPRTREPPQLPPEIWFIIMKMKRDIEEYERTLTIQELYQRRLNQGWTPVVKGNWIEESKQKKWNEMSVLKRILWKLGVVEEPRSKYWDSDQTQLSKIMEYK